MVHVIRACVTITFLLLVAWVNMLPESVLYRGIALHGMYRSHSLFIRLITGCLAMHKLIRWVFMNSMYYFVYNSMYYVVYNSRTNTSVPDDGLDRNFN